MRRGFPGIVLCLALATLLTGVARASLRDPFNGYADVAAVQSKVDGSPQESLRQDYNIGFDHRFLPYVDLRLAYRYYDFDQDLEALGAYRKEIQPSGELRWNHPLFLASTSLFRRTVETTGQLPIVTNSTQMVAKTKDRRYPLLEARYDQQHTYYTESTGEKDIRNQRVQASATYDPGVHNLSYTFSREISENVISDLETKSRRHLFRWSGADRFRQGGRLQLAGNYTFSYVTQLSEVRDGGPILRIVPILTGLYALDDAPDFGVLQPRSGLADGNTTAPVVPLIDIGGSSNNHNLGADLGSVRAVGGMYIYTDRPSGQNVSWSVWASSDNLTWTMIATVPQQVFNAALNRYELTLPLAFSYRFVKAVNSGLNEIAQVYITEIEVLEQVTGKSEQELQFMSHQADGRIGYRFNERWQGSADLSLQVEENPGRRGDRSRSSLGARVNYEPSETFTHNVFWELTRQSNEDLENATNNDLGYTLTADPLETLRGSFSVADRFSWLDGARSTHLLSSAAEANADLFPDLLATLGVGASRSEDLLGERTYRSWNVRGRLDAGITRSFDLILDATYQESVETVTDDLRTRLSSGVTVDWRITRDVYFRGTLRQTNQRTNRGNFDALLSWNILPSLRVSVQHYEVITDDLTTTLRQSVNMNWELSSRSNVYLRLTKVDLSGSGGTRTTSFQQGIRIGF